MREDTVDLKRRIEQNKTPIDREEEPVAKLLNLWKAYPGVNTPEVWNWAESPQSIKGPT